MNCLSNWWTIKTKSCSVEELEEILDYEYNENKVLNPFDKVYERIYISDGKTAINSDIIKQLKITHVLNASHGSDESLNLVNTSQEYYDNFGIKFFGIKAYDMTNFNLMPYFDESSNFMHTSIINKGSVLVHCKQGISRSSTIVLAYLMIKENIPIQQAIMIIRQNRQIYPNQGFLQQLCVLNDSLFVKES